MPRLPLLFALLLCATCWSQAQEPVPAESASAEKVIIDTDIGDDIDDAFALALALHSPELKILGVTTTFGDTELRAKLTDRFLGEAGRPDIPVAAGTATEAKNPMSQHRYAEGGMFAKPSRGKAVDFLLEQIQKYPGQITLIGIGPLINVGEAIDKDPATFKKLKRVVIMGGSIKRGYGDAGYGTPTPPEREWNIVNGISGA
ncbi:MAG TPA: nucleoside hydrolase, partial [Terriglobales bacterium]|nr:nucleoside hydrolase [Terriglobales bacterium]